MRAITGSLTGIVFLALLVSQSAAADTDTEFDQLFAIDDVNEGQLVFLETVPTEPVHHHKTTIDMSLPGSAGWVGIEQCHTDIDVVSRAQILFGKDKIRDLEVTRYAKLGKAWVEGHTVQLEDILPGATLCLKGQTRALQLHSDGTLVLRSGPFMRRFLDGYYPMHVSLEVRYDPARHQFLNITPVAQPGLKVWHNPGLVRYDAWFEGRLVTKIHFLSISE